MMVKKLLEDVTSIINDWDPLNFIAMGAPDDEYEIEINHFLPLMLDSTIENYAELIHQTFVEYLGESYRASREDEEIVALKLRGIIQNFA